jgi:hypothetical protein
MTSQNINLFQTKTTFQPILAMAEKYAKLASTILLSVVFVSGILVTVAFFVFGRQRDAYILERDQLLVQIKKEVSKESLFIMIRNRLISIDAIMNSQISYAPFIDTTIKIIQSFPLTSFTLGEKNSVSITVKVSTLEEATNVLSTILDMERKKEITFPLLQSFSMNEDKIQIGLSFIVVI